VTKRRNAFPDKEAEPSSLITVLKEKRKNVFPDLFDFNLTVEISFLHAKRHRSRVGGLEVIISKRARDKSRKVQSSKREKTRDKSRICEGGPDILGERCS